MADMLSQPLHNALLNYFQVFHYRQMRLQL